MRRADVYKRQAQARHHVPRIETAVDRVAGDGHRHLRNRHADAVRAERAHRFAGEPVGNMKPQALELRDRADGTVCVHDAAVAA